ncbi:MAG: TIGR02677 family protein [Mycobacteriales bacterium]
MATVGDVESAAGTEVDSFTLDDRLRLFSFATAQNRLDYLLVLRALDRARASYQARIHATDVVRHIDAVARLQARPTVEDVQALLEALHGWQILDRGFDGTRAASIAEYRNRHYVYQFTQAGYRAYRAVEDVLGARLEDASLSRLIFADVLADLHSLADANRAGDAETVLRRLTRLDQTLSDMRERADRFYLMLTDLSSTNETRPEVFLAHKDALLAHMREFAGELDRYTPKLADAIERVEATGVDRLVTHAASADDRVFGTPQTRGEEWQARWSGLVRWFRPADGGESEADRLQAGTISAIAGVLSLLRRITESRRGGISRESQLRHLAAWFTNAPTDRSAHALFDVAFGLGQPRHVSVVHPDPELIPTRRSWWDAPAVELSRTLLETGRTAAPGAPGRIERNDAGRRRLRADQLATQSQRTAAATALAVDGVAGRELDEAETRLLLQLLDLALSARVAVSSHLPLSGSAGASYGVRLTLRPQPTSTTVETVRGRIHLDRLALAVSAG